MFVALDPRGETYIVVPEDLDAVESIRVGDKLSLVSPLEGRYFHFDAVHRLPGDQVLWNGDRRLSDTGSAPEVAVAVSAWLKGSSAKNVFLGCTPHVPGSWWANDHHEHGTCGVQQRTTIKDALPMRHADTATAPSGAQPG